MKASVQLLPKQYGTSIKTDRDRPMEQKRAPRNKPMHICSTDFWQGCQEYTMRKGQSLPYVVLGKLDRYLDAKEWN